ncbi:MAG: MerR family transcriptional regulator [Streptosporangiaceae bacterium]
MAPSPLDDEHAPLYTVGQVAQMLAVKQAFLRRVDELRVVSPRRSPGGQRRYTRYEIRVIQQVVTMAGEGITLQAIRRIIDLERQLAAVTRERDELARRLAGLFLQNLSTERAGCVPSRQQRQRRQRQRRQRLRVAAGSTP